MKKEKIKLKVKPKKVRRKWLINPRTRVHNEPQYKRTKTKEEERELIGEELEESKEEE